MDSLIELASASTILWLYTGTPRGSDASERSAQRIIAVCFAVLALYVAFDSISTLVDGRHPDMSWLGVAVASLIDLEGEIAITLPEVVHVDSDTVARALAGV